MTTRATVHIAEDAITVIEDGDIFAVRQRGKVEIWTDDGETHLGNLPLYATELEIRKAAEFWRNGFAEGARFGRDEAQAKLRDALGIGS